VCLYSIINTCIEILKITISLLLLSVVLSTTFYLVLHVLKIPSCECIGESCWWTIHPASKQRSEGEKVRVGDDLILVSVASERYLVRITETRLGLSITKKALPVTMNTVTFHFIVVYTNYLVDNLDSAKRSNAIYQC